MTQLVNLLPLPDELMEKVYLYDPTYRQVFEVVLDEILIRARLQEERTEFLMQQQLKFDVFELNACLYLADLLGEDVF